MIIQWLMYQNHEFCRVYDPWRFQKYLFTNIKYLILFQTFTPVFTIHGCMVFSGTVCIKINFLIIIVVSQRDVCSGAYLHIPWCYLPVFIKMYCREVSESLQFEIVNKLKTFCLQRNQARNTHSLAHVHIVQL